MTNYAADTHSGNRRELNEDCYEADPEIGLWLVADGVGGHSSGEVASELTRVTIKSVYRDTGDLVAAVYQAHQEVLDAIVRQEGGANMGSTVVAAALKDGGYQIAWVGDSRAYMWDGKKLNQLTTDHSMVEGLIEKGAITREEARNHPKRNVITQSIGVSAQTELKVDTVSGLLVAGERLLLCSDGLNDELDNKAISAIMAQSVSPDSQVKQLIEGALNNGGRDNVTVVVIEPGEASEKNQNTSGETDGASNRNSSKNDSELDLYTVVMTGDENTDLDQHTIVMNNEEKTLKGNAENKSNTGIIKKCLAFLGNIFK